MTQGRQRYAPPRADVADLAAPDALLASRPRSVVWACALMLASLVISFVALLPAVDPPMPGEPTAMTALVWGITVVATMTQLWLLRCVWRRLNWARWLMVGLIVLAIASNLSLLEEDWARAPVVAWLNIVVLVLIAVAAGLLLARPSAQWFKAPPPR
jgi:hypothetical protein